MSNKSVGLMPPWLTYHEKVKALFGQDPDITVTDLAGDGKIYGFDINVQDAVKASAIKTILKSPVALGNILVTINVNGPKGTKTAANDADVVTILNNAFTGNIMFQKVEVIPLNPVISFYYCIFAIQVIQFQNDDLSSYSGYFSGLTSDVAKEILSSQICGTYVHYCIQVI